MDNTMSASTDYLLEERHRLRVSRDFARECDDGDWASSLTYRICMIEVELMRRGDVIR